MTQPRAYLSHVVLFCHDFDAMLKFYTEEIGFHLSDIGEARGQQMAFITLDPSLEHHQVALVGGRKGSDAGALHHLAFGVRTLEELHERHEHLKARNVPGIELWTHASMLSVYYRDIENNRLEFFLETPFYVKQPIAAQLDVDLSASQESVFRQIEDKYKDEPSFDLMSNWKARTALQRNGG